jgi:hypothetical protein
MHYKERGRQPALEVEKADGKTRDDDILDTAQLQRARRQLGRAKAAGGEGGLVEFSRPGQGRLEGREEVGVWQR